MGKVANIKIQRNNDWGRRMAQLFFCRKPALARGTENETLIGFVSQRRGSYQFGGEGICGAARHTLHELLVTRGPFRSATIRCFSRSARKAKKYLCADFAPSLLISRKSDPQVRQ
jgi:hypothetical protein